MKSRKQLYRKHRKKRVRKIRQIIVPHWADAIGSLASDYTDVQKNDHPTLTDPQC